MAEVIGLPSLGADMDTGTLLEWYVAPGDEVERGAVVALVSTDKADIDVEIWQRGTVEELLVDVDTEIPVGTPILRLSGHDTEHEHPGADLVDDDAASKREAQPRASILAAQESARPAVLPAPAAAESVALGARLRASPLARATAAARGIDLTTVRGSGPGGAVIARDLAESPRPEEPAASPCAHRGSSASQSPAATEPDPPSTSPMRRAIASRMATANAEIPHYYLEQDINLQRMLEWLAVHNDDIPIARRVLPAAVLLKATATAMVEVPELNGFWVGDRFEPAPSIDIAVVVSLRGGGLVTPQIGNVDVLDIDGVMSALTEIVTGARKGSLRSSWMVGAGLTVTSLGERGADRVSGVIFPPQVALVGFGAIRRRPWLDDQQGSDEPGADVVARPVVTASLAADHRATDGAVGSRFLASLARALNNPEEL